MVQTKKTEVREAILTSAHSFFREKGFLQTTMSNIARDAGISAANIYVYFPSKMHLFYEIYAPMVTSRMMRLANDARAIDDPRERLRFIFTTLWYDIPRDDNQFAHNLMEAVITAPEDLQKPHDPLKWLEEFTNDLIRECLPAHRQFLVKDSTISFLAWMAFDGFVVNLGTGEDRNIEVLVEHFADMLLGEQNHE